jgi:hypothetical protein
MNSEAIIHHNILVFYGLFLITCGIVAVSFIGIKAKTALLSGGLSGVTAWGIAFLISQYMPGAQLAGLLLSLVLICVFSWRSTKTAFTLATFIRENHPDVNGKIIAFLLISLMAVVSVFVFAVQFIYFSLHH